MANSKLGKTKNEIRAEILRRSNYRSGKEVLAAVPAERMSKSLGDALKSLLKGRNQLRVAHEKHLAKTAMGETGKRMSFALDGRLVGDIGELIAAETFQLDLLGTSTANVDAVTTTTPRRRVQIKATFQTTGLAIKHGRDYFIGLQLFDDTGEFRVVYNGPAIPIMRYLSAPKAKGHSGRTHAGKRLEPISLATWAVLDLDVDAADRIPRRTTRSNTN